MIHDLKYALRMMAKAPVFTAIAVATLALGIGANTAIFSVVKQVLLNSTGMHEPDRVVMLWPANRERNIPFGLVSPPLLEDWRAQNHVFSDMAAATDNVYTLTGMGEPESLISWMMTPNFMRVLGVDPLLGRWFTPEEGQPGRDHVVVLSYQLWQRKFGGDRNVIGRELTLNDAPYQVIGVMPQFTFLPFDLWTPLVISPAARTARTARFLRVAARLKDGVTFEQAQRDMDQLSARLGQQFPATDKGWAPRLQPVRDMTTGDIRAPLLALMGAVAFVLLIACSSVANLLLARSTARRREFAVRVALGARRGRIVRQLLTESMMVALGGCALGLAFATWATTVLVRLFPTSIANLDLPKIDHISVDAGVILFSITLAVLTGVVFGAAPALQTSSIAPETDLKEGSGRTIGSGATRRLRSGLVVAQVSLALVLLVAAGLMIKSFARLQQTSLGFNPDHVLTMQLFLPRNHYPKDPERMRFVEQVLTAIKPLPGVQSAGAVNFLPLTGFWGTLPISTPNAPPAPVPQWPTADYRIASDDYFRTMQIPLLRGRFFNSSDAATSQLVCVVNEEFTRRFFPGQDAIGKFVMSDPDQFGKTSWEIVGVIGNVKHFGAAEPAHAELYRPFSQDGFPLVAFTVRTAQDPLALADSARQAIWNVDKNLAITRVISMDDAASQSTALRRISMVILGFFAFCALLLAAMGIYGVVAYLVTLRTREIGIRMALGAQRKQILGMMVAQSFRVAAIGLAVGIAAALAVTRFLSSLLFQVRAIDPLTFIAVPAVLGVIALAAAWLPARRAAAVEPTIALRYE
ncbi:MAG TPA: ABC transporter permease [Terriglobales bacterium]|nr:ABC transporter permease [Terriglobales bacterium]